MTKSQIDRLLENAVAKAVGVPLPHKGLRVARPKRISSADKHAIRHAA